MGRLEEPVGQLPVPAIQHLNYSLRTLLKIFLVLVLVAALWLAWGLALPANPGKEKFVMLRPGSSTMTIADELRDAGVIRSSSAFLLYHYATKAKTLKAGEYRFDHSASAFEVHDRLVRGDIYFHVVVVPEGFNMFDVAAAMEAAGLGSRDNFLKIMRTSTALITELDPDAQSLEGYLFPDTYRFTRTQSMQEMVGTMVRRFRQEAKTIGLTSDVHRIVTLASIVEKETGAPEERPTVAGVYENRVEKHMALDADPSVIYAALLAGHYTGTIHQSDLQFDSPYNTYRVAGLPPGPIANPGLESLKAAMHPASTNYLYFVSDANGHHRFASTLDEHTRNVAAYRRAVANR